MSLEKINIVMRAIYVPGSRVLNNRDAGVTFTFSLILS